MAWGGAERRSAAAAELERLGFERRPRLARYEAPVQAYFDSLDRIVRRLRERGRIPGDAEICSLPDAPLGAILQLHLLNIGGDAGHLYERLRGRGPRPFDPRLSFAIVRSSGRESRGGNGKDEDVDVAAFMLCRFDYSGVAIVDTRVVTPRYRGDWANALLMHEAARRALVVGGDRFAFIGGDRHADTHKLARRVTDSTRIMDSFVRPFA